MNVLIISSTFDIALNRPEDRGFDGSAFSLALDDRRSLSPDDDRCFRGSTTSSSSRLFALELLNLVEDLEDRDFCGPASSFNDFRDDRGFCGDPSSVNVFRDLGLCGDLPSFNEDRDDRDFCGGASSFDEDREDRGFCGSSLNEDREDLGFLDSSSLPRFPELELLLREEDGRAPGRAPRFARALLLGSDDGDCDCDSDSSNPRAGDRVCLSNASLLRLLLLESPEGDSKPWAGDRGVLLSNASLLKLLLLLEPGVSVLSLPDWRSLRLLTDSLLPLLLVDSLLPLRGSPRCLLLPLLSYVERRDLPRLSCSLEDDGSLLRFDRLLAGLRGIFSSSLSSSSSSAFDATK